ncbi:hypothetical protein ACFFLZ_13165 [Photobacterium aphoticum]|uniref:hypothetical protein n=1 Tax=Photobacterium aphoticum TaxID=754436 RepID=UPI0011B29B02|nr:hypothetical protein [Photobacterium aphoticum]
MSYEIHIPGRNLSYDRAVKRDGEWIGYYSGHKFSDVLKKHPNAQIVDRTFKKCIFDKFGPVKHVPRTR